MDYKSPELTARVIIDNARDYIMLFMEKNNYDEGDFHPKYHYLMSILQCL